MPESITYQMDCMTAMREMPDNAFDLAVVDPPYGIGQSGEKNKTRGKRAKAKDYKPFEGGTNPPQTRSISANCVASAGIKLFSAQITLPTNCQTPRHPAIWCGTKITGKPISPIANWRTPVSNPPFACSVFVGADFCKAT